MSLGIAFKAFWKALKNPQQGKAFVEQKEEPSKLISSEKSDLSHIRLLSLLQESSRLIDFLKEDITGFTDAQVGAAVRKIHADSAENLEKLVTIRPVMDEQEGSRVTIPQGYDPTLIKVIGKVKGEPPFSGTLVHKGWKAVKRSLPKKMDEHTSDVIHPAEVEIK